MDHDYCSSITVPIEDMDHDESGSEKYFFIILKNPSNTSGLGDPNVARVTIINDNG